MSTHQKRLLLISIAQAEEIDDTRLDRSIRASRLLRAEHPDASFDIENYVAEFFAEYSSEVDGGPVKLEPPTTKRRSANLESREELERPVRSLLNGGISPTELTSILSALRDCKDDLRRNTIFDQMISCCFRETPEYVKSETEWRRLSESSLPDEDSLDD